MYNVQLTIFLGARAEPSLFELLH